MLVAASVVPLAHADDAPPVGLDAGNVFEAAVAAAQERTVKVYGAGIGRAAGYASGILVSADGLITTAYGVYLTGDRIRVGLSDGSIHEAQLVKKSNALQLALLKIDHATPVHFELSQSPVGQKGDWVLGVSNAFKVAEGPEPLSVNLGVIALRTRLEARFGAHDVEYQGDALLIDAITSNPGAPGGAVVTVDGRLAGMIGRIIESKASGTRINYAVPAEQLLAFISDQSPAESPATGVAEAPQQGGKSDLGMRLFRLGGRRAPAYVDRVVAGGPAAEAGIKTDDLIISINGQAVREAGDFEKISSSLPIGEEIGIVVKRGEKLTPLRITPRAAP
jgi:serine protease Do